VLFLFTDLVITNLQIQCETSYLHMYREPLGDKQWVSWGDNCLDRDRYLGI
jgi:hypothetical protein